jgi:hypothetical protein
MAASGCGGWRYEPMGGAFGSDCSSGLATIGDLVETGSGHYSAMCRLAANHFRWWAR